MKKLLLFFKLQLFLIFSGFIFISKASSDSVEALVKKYPTGSILSYSKAKSVLIEINPARIMIKENYATDRIKCFKRFFMSSCLNKIKDKRRVKLSSIRKIEVEAKAFLRKKRADDRDKALIERKSRTKNFMQDPTISIKGTTRPKK